MTIHEHEAPREETTEGLLLPCPRCGEASATIRLELADMDTCVCVDCDETFSLTDVRDWISRWSRVIRWVELFSQTEGSTP
jgi:hypothetical protein